MYCALIVDDESIIRRGLRCMIPWTSLGFGEVREAANAEAALRVTEETRVDLIVTDICMPGMDGLEMTRRLMAMQPGIRIIVLTGYDNFQYAQRCCALGVKHLLIKPVDESELTRLIASLVEEIRADGSMNFREAMEVAILPRLEAFSPDLLIISAGFDAHRRDPLANLNLVEQDFAWATGKLMEIADRKCHGRVVSLLEGGYDLDGLARSVAAHVLTLMGM